MDTELYIISGFAILFTGIAIGYGIASVRYKGKYKDQDVYRHSEPGRGTK